MIPLVAFGVLDPTGSLFGTLLLGAVLLGASSPLTLFGALGWKLVAVLSTRLG